MIAFFEIPINDFDKSVAIYQVFFGEKLEMSQFDDERMVFLIKTARAYAQSPRLPRSPVLHPMIVVCWYISGQMTWMPT